jgi:hypothetical protein
MLGDRVRLSDIVDVAFGAANEWVIVMTGVNRWNDQAQRTTVALVQAAGTVIALRTLLLLIATVLSGVPLSGRSSLGLTLLFVLVTSLLQSAVTLGPVAFLAAITPWHRIPLARIIGGLFGALLALQIAGRVSWGPPLGMLVVAGFWVGYKTANTPQALHASMVN